MTAADREPPEDPVLDRDGDGGGAGEPDEHVRFARYQAALAEIRDADAPAMICRVLADPSVGVGSSAVGRYVDRRASALLGRPEFADWAAAVAGAVVTDAFCARRLRSWTLRQAIVLGEPWRHEELLTGETRLQTDLAGQSTSVEVLTVLAESGRTRRIRNLARNRLPPLLRAQRSRGAEQTGRTPAAGD